MKRERKYTLWSNVRYIYRILFQEVPIMPLLMVAGIVVGILLPIINTAITAVAVGSITNGEDVGNFILVIFIVLVLYGTLVVVSKLVESWSEFYLSHVQSRKFLMGLLEKTLSADYDHVEPQEQQAMINGASHAVNVYRQGVHLMYATVPTIISSVIGLILYSATITILDVRILLVIIVMNIVGILLNMRAVRISRNLNEEQYRLWGRVYYLKRQTMSIEGGKDIRIYGMGKWFRDAFQKETNRNREMGKIKSKGWTVASTIDIVFSLARDLLSYGIVISQVLDGTLGIAEATFAIGIVAGFSNWVHKIQEGYVQLSDGNIMMVEYRKMIDFPDRFLREGGIGIEQIKDAFNSGNLEISFEHVSFRYEEEGPYILRDINLRIKPGEKIALVGHNGAGKTTLIKLLCGLYHPTEGQILVGGHSIDAYNLTEYQRLLTTIFQDVNILPLSILENVSGKTLKETDYSLARKCLEQAGLQKDIEKLPKKELTYLTQTFAEDGVQLSGGMVQKLMMARALYKQAPVLILDEPTAALDPIAESRLYEEYNQFSKNKTSIFISHRLASTRFCHRIIYLENGMIAEEGTHDALMKQKGKYANVFEVQSQYYQEEVPNI